MKLLIIDGQGGGIGSRLIAGLAPALAPECNMVCVGTNALATNAMLKAGAQMGATGENAVCYNAQRADVILGPMGIVLANSMLGEITPAMAAAVSGAQAKKILVPSTKCPVLIAGMMTGTLEDYIQCAVRLAVAEMHKYTQTQG